MTRQRAGLPCHPKIAARVIALFLQNRPAPHKEHDLTPHEVRVVKLLGVLNRIGGMALDLACGAALSGRGPAFERVPPARWLAVQGGSPIRLSTQLLVDGHNYKTAAVELNVSVNTISFHMRRIYDKLHVHTKSEAVAKALRAQIVG